MTGHIPYLNTEYARNKDQECYDIEARQKEKALDDGQQEGNEYKTKKQAAPVKRIRHNEPN
jgi:hypothetical protein